ncbi:WhiB family transcriptional regulator (plasmid) [Mycolicibacterium crocinum]|uniref:WhiB family transcriptional regulator n=1 Tax=Mycolicibacterium crocinum TaxID=388459 RepID=A0ABY3TUR5_9MYCO|nr:WhiB family transcriptional regulator [Mycolicibacterium crocinum]ULN44696.1 WhiB family transcriptional regulator [Mycolicibacterium crocinum]
MSRTLGSGPRVSAGLPCHAEPDRWFDREDRSVALRGCLACPVRGWCAREALRTRASWGMWAGVWIDGQHRDAIGYLRSVAAAPPTPVVLHRPNGMVDKVAPQRRYASASPQALIAARSSGHCEVMLDGCRYSGDVLLSRVTGCPDPDLPTAAHGFLACPPCQSRLEQPARIAVRELGYRLHSPTEALTAPFYWRQSGWAILDPGGQRHASIGARHRRAS